MHEDVSKRIVTRMANIVNQLRESPCSMSDRDRYALGIWAFENALLGLISQNDLNSFVETVCPDYYVFYLAHSIRV